MFWERFIFKYYWGPVEADARDRDYQGVSEGYNPVNTLTYGVVVALSLYAILKYFNKIGLKVDQNFILAILPFVVVGSITRCLEDAKLFEIPLSYFFISPLIYIFLGLLVISLISYFHKIEVWLKKKGKYQIWLTSFFVTLPYLLMVAFYTSFFLTQAEVFSSYLPLSAVLLLSLFFAFISLKNQKEKGFKLKLQLGLFGLYLVAFFSFYVISFLFFDRWYKEGEELRLWTIPLIFGLAIFFTSLLFLIAKLMEKKTSDLKRDGMFFNLRLTFLSFLSPLNLSLLFSHFLDASATFVGIDYFSYREKHVLPSLLIEMTGTAFVMFPLKFLIVFLIIYMVDIYYKDEIEETGQQSLSQLLKLAVIVLGLAPGMRDALRLAMGV